MNDKVIFYCTIGHYLVCVYCIYGLMNYDNKYVWIGNLIFNCALIIRNGILSNKTK